MEKTIAIKSIMIMKEVLLISIPIRYVCDSVQDKCSKNSALIFPAPLPAVSGSYAPSVHAVVLHAYAVLQCQRYLCGLQ